MIVFFANYPDNSAELEGMSQRVVAVDNIFEESERIYLFVSHRKFINKEVIHLNNNVVQYRLNLVRHLSLILKLCGNAKTLYFHSVLNVLPVLPILFLFAKKKVRMVLDVHGVVPEEQALNGLALKSKLYDLTERLIVDKLHTIIAVTNSMAEHYQRKYPTSSPKYIVYGILPSHLLKDEYVPEKTVADDYTRIVYSGNLQKWQNVDLMIEVIKANLFENFYYYILTGDIDSMKKRLNSAGLLGMENIEVRTVRPWELKNYYRIAHYGFVLRDDITVNQVACPTKLVEYLYYGIIPIVKSPLIGDFANLGYEYVSFSNLSGLKPAKSAVNHQIVKRMQEKSSLKTKLRV